VKSCFGKPILLFLILLTFFTNLTSHHTMCRLYFMKNSVLIIDFPLQHLDLLCHCFFLFVKELQKISMLYFVLHIGILAGFCPVFNDYVEVCWIVSLLGVLDVFIVFFIRAVS
jgi:hypothetical protein